MNQPPHGPFEPCQPLPMGGPSSCLQAGFGPSVCLASTGSIGSRLLILGSGLPRSARDHVSSLLTMWAVGKIRPGRQLLLSGPFPDRGAALALTSASLRALIVCNVHCWFYPYRACSGIVPRTGSVQWVDRSVLVTAVLTRSGTVNVYTIITITAASYSRNAPSHCYRTRQSQLFPPTDE